MKRKTPVTPSTADLSTAEILEISPPPPAPPAPVDIWLHPVLALMIAMPNVYLGDVYGDKPLELTLFGVGFLLLFALLSSGKLGPRTGTPRIPVHPVMLLCVTVTVTLGLLLGRLLFLEGIHV